MSSNINDLATSALELSATERVTLAKRLWESLDAQDRQLPDLELADAADEARRRAAELDAGTVEGVPHDDVMKFARDS